MLGALQVFIWGSFPHVRTVMGLTCGHVCYKVLATVSATARQHFAPTPAMLDLKYETFVSLWNLYRGGNVDFCHFEALGVEIRRMLSRTSLGLRCKRIDVRRIQHQNNCLPIFTYSVSTVPNDGEEYYKYNQSPSAEWRRPAASITQVKLNLIFLSCAA